MKKVLLSLSMLAATVFAANAQNQIVLWNAATSTSQVSGVPFNFGVPGTGNPLANPPIKPTPVAANPSVDGGLRVDTSMGVIHGFGSCSATKYYVGGFGVGSFARPAVGKPFGTNVTGSGGSLTTYYLNVEIKAAGTTAPKIKFQLSSKDSTNVQGYILDLTSATGVATTVGYKIYSIALGSFSNTIGQYGNPINTRGNFMTNKFADSLYKIEYAVTVGTTTDGSGSVVFDIKNQWISTSKTGIVVTSTTSAAANISSSVVYPNPTSGALNVNITLQTPAKVTMIVTDMVGKQIATQNFGTVSSLQGVEVFDATGLAKGMYTVTYVLDGTPAKTELVVVK